MFNLKLFIVKNLFNGVKNGTFTKEYANIAAVNYLAKGMLAEENVISVNAQIEVWEAEQKAHMEENTVVSAAVEEVIIEEETGVEMDEYKATDEDSTVNTEELISEDPDGKPLT